MVSNASERLGKMSWEFRRLIAIDTRCLVSRPRCGTDVMVVYLAMSKGQWGSETGAPIASYLFISAALIHRSVSVLLNGASNGSPSTSPSISTLTVSLGIHALKGVVTEATAGVNV